MALLTYVCSTVVVSVSTRQWSHHVLQYVASTAAKSKVVVDEGVVAPSNVAGSCGDVQAVTVSARDTTDHTGSDWIFGRDALLEVSLVELMQGQHR